MRVAVGTLVVLMACQSDSIPAPSTAGDGGSNGGTNSATTGGTAGASGSSEGQATGACVGLGAALHDAGFDPDKVAWRFVREQPEGWRAADGVFELQSLPGTLWQGSNNLQNVAVRPSPGDTFVAEVTVQGPVEVGAEQAGLLWYGGDDDYIKLVKELVGTQRAVVLVVERGGAPTVVGNVSIESDLARLKLERTATGFVGSFRLADADPWTEVGQVDDDLAGPEPSGLGLFSQGDGMRWIAMRDLLVIGG